MFTKRLIVFYICVAGQLAACSQNWDVAIAKNINPHDPHSDYWKLTSSSAYFISAAVPVSLLLAGIIKKDKQLKRNACTILGSIIIEIAISELTKNVFDRPRPAEKFPHEIFPYRNVTGRSFPSGHTSLAFATATSLSLAYKKWYVTLPSYLWATSVGYSRIYLGVHYPADVVAGAAVGIGSALLSQWLTKKIFRR